MNAEPHNGGISVFAEEIAQKLFLLLVFSLALMQPFYYFGGLRLSPTDFIFPLIGVFLFLATIFKRIRFRWHNFYLILLFYFAALVFSACFSLNPRQSFRKLAGEIYLMALAVMTFNLVKTEIKLKKTIKYWLAGTSIAVLIGIFSLFLFYFQPENIILNYTTYHYGSVPVGNYPRLSAAFVSASMFCNYLNVSFMLILAALQTNTFNKTILLVLLALVSICAVFTISAGLGAFALAFGLWLWAGLREKRKTAALLALMGGIAVSLVFFLINFFALQKHSSTAASIKIPLSNLEFQPSARLLIWRESLETFRNNLFTGVGLGEDVCRVVFQNTDGTTSVLTDAHNYLLNVAAQNGVFGLLAIMLVTGAVIKTGFASGTNQSDCSKILVCLTIAFVCAFFYQGLTGSFEEARHLWVLIGMILSAEQLKSENSMRQSN